MNRIIKISIIILFLWTATACPVLAFQIKEDFPKLANYYLNPTVPKSEHERLAKYDLVILDVDAHTIDPALFKKLKEINPNIKTFAYLPSQSVNVAYLDPSVKFRTATYDETEAHNRWLRDSHGGFIAVSDVWPTIRYIDIGNGWSNYLSNLIKNDVMATGAWDGIFYDMISDNLDWLHNGDIDLNKDGQKDNMDSVNRYWRANNINLLAETRKRIFPSPVIANIDRGDRYDSVVDGMMMENFPAPWIGKNGWAILAKKYLNSARTVGSNKIYIINANSDNGKISDVFKNMRFGLTSALLGNGYYSFDFGDQNHAQTWWYDEYDVKLGKAKTNAYNLLNKKNTKIQAGLWRRDFENGIALVNSTSQTQKYVFEKEEFEKINGVDDRRVNDGTKINWVKLAPGDGVIFLKVNNEIFNVGYNNGNFVRSFNIGGEQTRNGFFVYKDAHSGDSQVLVSDMDNSGTLLTLVNGQGVIAIYDSKGIKKTSFAPYGDAFKGSISFAVGDLNGDKIKEVITGREDSGDSQIKVFAATGKTINSGFFAFGKNSRGGVSVAAGDINRDGKDEIIAGSGAGINPSVKIFKLSGKELGGFRAYGSNLHARVNVAAGDVNNDGQAEIITSPGAGAGPNVRIYSKDGKMLFQFFAFDKSVKTGIKVMVGDTNNDKANEILVSTSNLNNVKY